jgi:hypothetical protein
MDGGTEDLSISVMCYCHTAVRIIVLILLNVKSVSSNRLRWIFRCFLSTSDGCVGRGQTDQSHRFRFPMRECRSESTLIDKVETAIAHGDSLQISVL